MPNLLVIDDDDDYREYLTVLLSRRGYRVCGLSTGRSLREAIAAERFDAVITDLYMPSVDGIEVVRAVKEVVPNVTVIGITGSGGGRDACSRAMMTFGAADVLTKPIDAAALFEALRSALSLG
jgi:DNA-binding NtrC family response regulator